MRFALEEHTCGDDGVNHDFTLSLDGRDFALEPSEMGNMEDVTFGELRRMIEILNRLEILDTK